MCEEFLARRDQGSAAYSKVLPRLLRQAAAELRRRGWDPLVLLFSVPDQPAAGDDVAPGGVEGEAPQRRRWLHTPEDEVELLDEKIAARRAAGHSTEWHQERRAQLQQLLEERA